MRNWKVFLRKTGNETTLDDFNQGKMSARSIVASGVLYSIRCPACAPHSQGETRREQIEQYQACQKSQASGSISAEVGTAVPATEDRDREDLDFERQTEEALRESLLFSDYEQQLEAAIAQSLRGM
jgi:hypothetical protein